jgi:hypothetical protein
MVYQDPVSDSDIQRLTEAARRGLGTEDDAEDSIEKAIRSRRSELIYRLNDNARREDSAKKSILQALNKQKLVIITGAGVTINATSSEDGKPIPCTTWKGLLLDRLRYLISLGGG